MNAHVPELINQGAAIDSLMAAMREQGIETQDSLRLDGLMERFHVEGDRKGSKNGWVIAHIDATPNANFGSHKLYPGHTFRWKANVKARSLSAVERKAEQEERARRKAAKAAAEAQRHADAAERAKAAWDAAVPAPADHPYLARKAIGAHGVRLGVWEVVNPDTGEVRVISDKALLVPMIDAKRKIWSLQAILPGKLMSGGTRDKDYLLGGRKDGLFSPIGSKPKQHEGRNVFVVCEGWATGASIYEATGHMTLVAFDAGNLLAVADALREKQADAVIVLAADHDQWTTKPIPNPGRHYAKLAAASINGLVAFPPFPADAEGRPTDFNDLHVRQGLEAVAERFSAALHNAHVPAEPELAVEVEIDLDDEPPAHVTEELPVVEEMPDGEGWHPTVADEDEDDVPATVIGSPMVMQDHDFPDRSKKMRPLNTIRNLDALMQHYGITARYNLINKETELVVPDIWTTSDNAQNVHLAHLNSLAAQCGLPRENLTEYVKAIADANAYNPVLQWIESKPWDGVSRIQALAETLTLVESTGAALALRDLLVRRWVIACAAALEAKGFSHKGVLTLHGAQDLGKTSWFRRLAPAELGAFREGVSLNPESKDSVMTAVSHWIVELGELESTLRRDMESLKSFITQPVDRLRRPYDRVDSEYPRRTVFCASVNSQKFLKDDTGNGRFWVIECASVDYRHEIDMQQVWAEALALYRSGEAWHLTPAEKAQLNEGNEKFRQVSPIEELITTLYDLGAPNRRWITATSLLIEIGYDKPTRAQATETGQILQNLEVSKRSRGGRTEYYLPSRLTGDRYHH